MSTRKTVASVRSDCSSNTASRSRLLGFWVVGAIFAALLTLWAIVGFSPTDIKLGTNGQLLQDCLAKSRESFSHDIPASTALSSATVYCLNYTVRAKRLDDWDIRRNKFALQEYEEKLMLGVVIVMTVAGLGLAGIQLWTSYLIAITSKTPLSKPVTTAEAESEAHISTNDLISELSIEKGKLVLRSSIIGLVILGFSFGLFSLYVWKVYPLTTLSVATLATNQPAPSIGADGASAK